MEEENWRRRGADLAGASKHSKETRTRTDRPFYERGGERKGSPQFSVFSVCFLQ